MFELTAEIGNMTSHKIDPNFSLANKVAMITGGAAGIGRAIADLFAEKGAKLVLIDKSDSVRDVAAEFSAKGIESLGHACRRGNEHTWSS